MKPRPPGVAMCTAALLSDPLAASAEDVRAAGQAARGAGFESVSVWLPHLPALTGLGLRVGAVEAASRWASSDADAAAAEVGELVGAAAEQGAAKLLAACLDPVLADPDGAQKNLAALTDAARSAGIQVCLEFLPWTGIPDLATAWALVEPLGPAAGIVLDTWHWARQPGGPAWEVLAGLPGERVGYLQISDAAPDPTGDVLVETMTGRLLPGDGVVEFAALFTVLRSLGARPYVAIEVFNPGLVIQHGSDGAAQRMKAAADRLLAGDPLGR